MTDAVDPRIAEAYHDTRLGFVADLTDHELCKLHRATQSQIMARKLDAREDRAEVIGFIAFLGLVYLGIGLLIGWLLWA